MTDTPQIPATDDVGKILGAARSAVADGKFIVERACQDYRLDKPLDDIGSLTRVLVRIKRTS